MYPTFFLKSDTIFLQIIKEDNPKPNSQDIQFLFIFNYFFKKYLLSTYAQLTYELSSYFENADFAKRIINTLKYFTIR